MDGKWNKWWVVPLFFLALPKIIWYRLFPEKPSPAIKHMQAFQKRALEERETSLAGLPVTEQEEDAWRELEKRQ